MLPEFINKIEEIKAIRDQKWKSVRTLEQDIKGLKKDEKELNGVLLELLTDGLRDESNVFTVKRVEKQKELKENYPIRTTQCVDEALKNWEDGFSIDGSSWTHLMEIVQTYNEPDLRYQAAVATVALCKNALEHVNNYPDALEYKVRLDMVMTELVKGQDAELYYAQWGKILHEQCVQKIPQYTTPAAEAEKIALGTELLKEANDKFQHVNRRIAEIALYRDFVSGNEENEARLMVISRRIRSAEPLAELEQLLNNRIDGERKLIQDYRGRLLRNLLVQMGNECIDIGSLKERIQGCAATFTGDVSDMIAKYEDAYSTKKDEENTGIINNYLNNNYYLKQLPSGYQKIDTNKYKAELSAFLRRKSVNERLIEEREEWLHDQTKEFIKENKAKFDGWQLDYIKQNTVAYYKNKIRASVDTIQERPTYAVEYYASAEIYKNELYRKCTNDTYRTQLEKEAVENEWLGTIPDEVIKSYLKKGEEELRLEIKIEEANRRKQKIVDFFMSIPRAVTGFFNGNRAVESPLNDMVIPIIIVLVIVVGVAGISKLSGNGVSTGFFESLQSYENMTDEELLEVKEKSIDELEVELSPTATPASAFTYAVVDYLDGGEVIEIQKYNGTDEVVEIPAVIDGKNVAYISAGAFADNFMIKKVIMPDTIWKIHDGSIVGFFTSPGAFTNCQNLEEVVLSKNLTYIGNGAFHNCSALKSVQITGGEHSSLQTISDYAFAACYALESMTIQTDTYKELKVGVGAFGGDAALKNISINGERLESVVLGNQAFQDCDGLETLPFTDKITAIGESTFKTCISLNAISLPNITNIPKEAFRDCTALTSFEVSNKVTGIENDAFRGCTNLAAVTFESLPEGEVATGRYIRDYAFADAIITEVEIPGCYEQIGSHAFGHCPQLTKFVWHAGSSGINQIVNGDMFVESPNLIELYLPKTVQQFETLNIPSSCTIFAAENSAGYTYAMANSRLWSTWTE